MPCFLSSLLHRTRAAILAMLLVVLPLQGVAQLVVGIQGQRHLHTGSVAGSSHADPGSVSLRGALRAVLERLNAAHAAPLRLDAQRHAWLASKGPSAGLHAHGDLHHEHSHYTDDVLAVGDPADDSLQGGATVFQAWLPASLTWAPADGGAHPATPGPGWRDRVVAPPLMPPRG